MPTPKRTTCTMTDIAPDKANKLITCTGFEGFEKVCSVHPSQITMHLACVVEKRLAHVLAVPFLFAHDASYRRPVEKLTG